MASPKHPAPSPSTEKNPPLTAGLTATSTAPSSGTPPLKAQSPTPSNQDGKYGFTDFPRLPFATPLAMKSPSSTSNTTKTMSPSTSTPAWEEPYSTMKP